MFMAAGDRNIYILLIIIFNDLAARFIAISLSSSDLNTVQTLCIWLFLLSNLLVLQKLLLLFRRGVSSSSEVY